MKLILTADVENLGESGDIVEVKDGYGRTTAAPRFRIKWTAVPSSRRGHQAPARPARCATTTQLRSGAARAARSRFRHGSARRRSCSVPSPPAMSLRYP